MSRLAPKALPSVPATMGEAKWVPGNALDALAPTLRLLWSGVVVQLALLDKPPAQRAHLRPPSEPLIRHVMPAMDDGQSTTENPLVVASRSRVCRPQPAP